MDMNVPLKFFGMPWPGNSWLDTADRATVPVGDICCHCEEIILGTDSGYVHPEGPLHNSCFWFIVNTHYFSKKIIADELFEAWMKRAAK